MEIDIWLKSEFIKANHVKYHHYFDNWISNITENQRKGFEKQMISQINKSMIQQNK